ncbi:MAG: hypothetical protein LBO71_06745 [Prevotellaceae bacterium]|jgi:hypothetical protein|nr:hypothetical protein [Prevotellaceae bacterium]
METETIEDIITIVFIVVFVALVIYIIVSSMRAQKTPRLPKVETGHIVEPSLAKSNPIAIDKVLSFGKKFVVKGKKYDASSYILVRADGSSMKRRGINNGDIVYARKFDSAFGKENIQPDDILLIYLNDDRYQGYKIRVCRKYNHGTTNELETYYYDSDGNERVSSKPHRLDLVQGIVKYKYSE